jgi:PAS domain S-box-containing protein
VKGTHNLEDTLEPDPIRALLIDDDQGDFEMTRAIASQIENPAILLDWVSTFEEGRDAFEAGEHDIYIVDYFLEDRNGIDLIKEARRQRLKAPLIMLTGRGSHEVDKEAMRAGAADYLVKGQIDPQILERTIRYALDSARSRAALRESEERHRSMFDHLPIGLYRCTSDGHFLDANPALIRILGYPDPKTLDKSYASLLYVNPADRPAFDEELERLGVVRGFETTLTRLDGSEVRVRNTARAHRDASGDIAYIEGAVEEALDTAQAADAARYQALWSVARRAALVVTSDGTVLEANDVFTQASGYPVASIEGAPYSDFFEEDAIDLVHQELRAAMSPDATPTSVERRFVTSDGEHLWATVTIVPILTGPQAGAQAIVLLDDLSDVPEG